MAQVRELSLSITEFLNNSSVPRVRRCPGCGAIMEYLPVTFYFDGEAWISGCQFVRGASLQLWN